jgi:alpha-tubulin suppressor-like RCC1 family protein
VTWNGGSMVSLRGNGRFYGNGLLRTGAGFFPPPPGYEWLDLSMMYESTLAVRSDGTLWGWGLNETCMLGLPLFEDGEREFYEEPTQVLSSDGVNDQWAAASLGSGFGLGIRKDGTLWGWGDRRKLDVGPGLAEQPELYDGGSWRYVSAGDGVAFAIKGDGSLWSLRENYPEPLGLQPLNVDPNFSSQLRPFKLVRTADDFNYHYAIDEEGKLWTWMPPGFGGTPFGAAPGASDYELPVPMVGGAGTWAAVGAGGAGWAMAIGTDGSLWGIGDNFYGQLGVGDAVGYTDEFLRVGSANDWRSVACGYYNALAIKENNSLWAAGDGSAYNLGIGHVTTSDDYLEQQTPDNAYEFVQVGSGVQWSNAATNGYGTAVGRAGEDWYTWGNYPGSVPQFLGIPFRITNPTYQEYETVSSSLYGFCSTTLSIRKDGSLWGWGFNRDEVIALLDNPEGPELVKDGWAYDLPLRIGTDDDWSSVHLGGPLGMHALALNSSGELYTWGSNLYGESGLAFDTFNRSPERVGSDTWAEVAAGGDSSMGIKSDGTLWGWGSNAQRRIGLPDLQNYYAITLVDASNDWHSLSLNQYGNGGGVAIKNYQEGLGGELWAWGGGTGVAATVGRIGSFSDCIQIAKAGNDVAFAIRFDALTGHRTLWRLARSGGSWTFVQVGTKTDWISIAASNTSYAAVDASGEPWVWGTNVNAELGIPTGTLAAPTKLFDNMDNLRFLRNRPTLKKAISMTRGFMFLDEDDNLWCNRPDSGNGTLQTQLYWFDRLPF